MLDQVQPRVPAGLGQLALETMEARTEQPAFTVAAVAVAQARSVLMDHQPLPVTEEQD